MRETRAVAIQYRLCPLSPKRLALLEEDPEMAFDLTSEEVPDLLDLGTEGFELAGILLFAGKDAVRDAVFAQTGRDLGEVSDMIRVHSPERVTQIAEALVALPDDTVDRHYEAARRAMAGRLPLDAKSHFGDLFEELRQLYVATSAAKQSMLTFMIA
jgi:hypothetical protein